MNLLFFYISVSKIVLKCQIQIQCQVFGTSQVSDGLYVECPDRPHHLYCSSSYFRTHSTSVSQTWALQLSRQNSFINFSHSFSGFSTQIPTCLPPHTFMNPAYVCLSSFSENHWISSLKGYLLPPPRLSGNKWDHPCIYFLKRILFGNEYLGGGYPVNI